MSSGLVLMLAALFALVLSAGLDAVLTRRGQWLIACLLLALAYIVLSLGLERRTAPDWMAAPRWGLLALTLLAYLRYRFPGRGPRWPWAPPPRP